MNIYRHSFSAPCPNNAIPVDYAFELATIRVVMVEDIVAACAAAKQADRPYHETIADTLFSKFGGRQTLIAFHHGVQIETRRG